MGGRVSALSKRAADKESLSIGIHLETCFVLVHATSNSRQWCGESGLLMAMTLLAVSCPVRSIVCCGLKSV